MAFSTPLGNKTMPVTRTTEALIDVLDSTAATVTIGDLVRGAVSAAGCAERDVVVFLFFALRMGLVDFMAS